MKVRRIHFVGSALVMLSRDRMSRGVRRVSPEPATGGQGGGRADSESGKVVRLVLERTADRWGSASRLSGNGAGIAPARGAAGSAEPIVATGSCVDMPTKSFAFRLISVRRPERCCGRDEAMVCRTATLARECRERVRAHQRCGPCTCARQNR